MRFVLRTCLRTLLDSHNQQFFPKFNAISNTSLPMDHAAGCVVEHLLGAGELAPRSVMFRVGANNLSPEFVVRF